MKIKTLLGAVALTTTLAISATAAVIIDETFTYRDGALTGNAAWDTHSGTAGQISVVGGAITLTDSNSEDVNSSFTPVTSGTLFASFDISVADPIIYTGNDYEYFAHFKDDGFDYMSRLDIAAFSASGYSLGLSQSSTAEVVSESVLSYGANYSVVLGFDFTSGLSTLWIDTTSITDTNITTSAVDSANDISAFAFRQGSSSPDQEITIDNLIVATTFAEVVPEPGTYALLAGMFALASVMLRRRSVK